MIDYLRYNAYFASEIYSNQPKSACDQLNRMEYRPLEGSIFTVSPFNFTAIASNLNMSVVLMGNTTVWKPASNTLFLCTTYLTNLRLAPFPYGSIPHQHHRHIKVRCNSGEIKRTDGKNETFKRAVLHAVQLVKA